MYYINDSIISITTKWLSQLLQKVEANKLWSWGEAEKSGKFKIQYKIKYFGPNLLDARPPAGASLPPRIRIANAWVQLTTHLFIHSHSFNIKFDMSQTIE